MATLVRRQRTGVEQFVEPHLTVEYTQWKRKKKRAPLRVKNQPREVGRSESFARANGAYVRSWRLPEVAGCST